MHADWNSQHTADFPCRSVQHAFTVTAPEMGRQPSRVEAILRTWRLRSSGILEGMLRDSLRIVSISAAPLIVRPAQADSQVIISGSPACPAVALTFDLCPVRKGAGY